MSLTNTQYDTLMRAYDEKQIRRQHERIRRKEELNRAIPELAAVDRELAHTNVSLARHLLNDDTAETDSLRLRAAELRSRRDSAVQAAGYPPDYLEPPYECPDCKDTGYIGRTRCHCFRQAAIDLIYTQSNLKEILPEENFSKFSLEYYSEEDIDPISGLSARDCARKAEQACRQFADSFEEQGGNLLLFGNTGLGKTFLSHCIAKELLDHGHSVIYFSAQQFFDILADHAFHHDSGNMTDYDNIFDCDLLIIDDLGTELPNALTVSQFFACLNDRIMHRRSTMISTNLTLKEIDQIYSERISSRITDNFRLLNLHGRDIRILKKLRGR